MTPPPLPHTHTKKQSCKGNQHKDLTHLSFLQACEQQECWRSRGDVQEQLYFELHLTEERRPSGLTACESRQHRRAHRHPAGGGGDA